VFECVINLSEGRDAEVLKQLRVAAGSSLRDLHSDEFHHRSVFTLINEPVALVRDVQSLISAAYERLDLSAHAGVHPRFGVVDVVPFVALDPQRADEAVMLRDDLAPWLADTFHVPVFLYGPLRDGSVRTLPQVRKSAFTTLSPDAGPDQPSPRIGSVALGARALLVAWNVWLTGVTLDVARSMATAVRQESVRALAFQVGDDVQVSCNIVDVQTANVSQVYDLVVHMLPAGGAIHHAELVGLAPLSLLEVEDPKRWGELGLSAETTIEARCA
jgi:glutamate formiminotransferase / 5-formyltetrahydrofolate cyclo-ligase